MHNYNGVTVLRTVGLSGVPLSLHCSIPSLCSVIPQRLRRPYNP